MTHALGILYTRDARGVVARKGCVRCGLVGELAPLELGGCPWRLRIDPEPERPPPTRVPGEGRATLC